MGRIEPWSSEFAYLVTPEELQCVQSADRAWAIFVGDDPIAIAGIEIYSVGSNTAFAWMIRCPALVKHKIAFAKLSRQFFRELKSVYSNVYGVVHCENANSQQWLKWLGFKLVPAEGQDFLFFVENK